MIPLRRLLPLLLASITVAQKATVRPSNDTADLSSIPYSLNYNLSASGGFNSTDRRAFPSMTLAQLSLPVPMSYNDFVLPEDYRGPVGNTNAMNIDQVITDIGFHLVSCDPEDYVGQNIGASDLLDYVIATSQQATASSNKTCVVFYSTRAAHCITSNFTSVEILILTTTDPSVAADVVGRNFTTDAPADGSLKAIPSSYTGFPTSGNSGYVPGSTTAVAMVVLYAITGIITALFVVIIITGAVRAHRHPERYGPRNAPGRTRQSRAKGIARAMLETLPIVKFGDHHDQPMDKNKSKEDIEMRGGQPSNATASTRAESKPTTTAAPEDIRSVSEGTISPSKEAVPGGGNADGSDEAGSLGCSICTEDFQRGEEVRVLPCNHKFHPECVDPWLLNVSGTCPLCRVNLTSEGQVDDAVADANGDIAPPLASATPFTDRRSQAIHHLMAIAYGSREERVTALRQYGADRRNRHSTQLDPEERVSRARRLREALRIRTRTHEPTETEVQMRNSGLDAVAGSQMRP